MATGFRRPAAMIFSSDLSRLGQKGIDKVHSKQLINSLSI